MERYQPQPPKETRMFRSVSQQAIADLLRTLPTPITITQHLDTEKETLFYRYQVGKTTRENPVGIRMGATLNFLAALRFSLEAVMGRQQEEAEGQMTRRAQTRPKDQAPAADEWVVPEVERGEATSEQAATLGLPYRHRITGETIAEWAERRPHDQRETTSQRENVEGEQQEQEGRGGTYRAFGDILSQTETEDGLFTERIVTETDGRRVVMCSLNGVIKLYRIEWTEPDGWQANKAVSTLRDAMDAYQAIVPPSQQGEV